MVKTKILVISLSVAIILSLIIGGVAGSLISKEDITQSQKEKNFDRVAKYICQNAMSGKYVNTLDAQISEVRSQDGFDYWKIDCSGTQSNLINFLN